MPVLRLSKWTCECETFKTIWQGIVLVVEAPPTLQNATENPLGGVVKYKGVGKFFLQILPIILETVKRYAHSYYGTLTEVIGS